MAWHRQPVASRMFFLASSGAAYSNLCAPRMLIAESRDETCCCLVSVRGWSELDNIESQQLQSSRKDGLKAKTERHGNGCMATMSGELVLNEWFPCPALQTPQGSPRCRR